MTLMMFVFCNSKPPTSVLCRRVRRRTQGKGADAVPLVEEGDELRAAGLNPGPLGLDPVFLRFPQRLWVIIAGEEPGILDEWTRIECRNCFEFDSRSNDGPTPI